jgi:AcrR family transcriptional regulator
LAGGRRRAEQAEQTRQRLLEAGLGMLREEPAERLFEKLQAQAISSRAGVSTGSFYHHFDSQDGYIGSLLEYALANQHNPQFAQAVAVFEQKLTQGASFLDAIMASCARVMEWQQTNVTFSLQMAVWAKSHRDPAMARRLDRMYRMVEDETSEYYEVIMKLVGREMRPPFVVTDLAGTFSAIMEGLSVRRGVSPAAVPDNRFGSLLVSVIAMMTREVGNEGDTRAWLELNSPRWATA